jgi:hypothetical protein
MPPRHIALLLALGAGCTWVSPADLEAKRGSLDDDGDGFNAAEDCDDADKRLNPSAEEVWYDGVDQNCAGDDDFDGDGDGYVPDEHVGKATAGAPGTGTLPGGDCADADAAVSPAITDLWYDGVDANCDGADDYDADRDGFVSADYEGLPTQHAEGLPALPTGDCDDEDGRVNPSAVDPPYNGVDEDCAGDDDFDADGDGYVPDQYVGRATLYLSGSGDLPGGDCDDLDPATHAGADEDHYDGVDTDCDRSTVDFDQDGDGFTADAATGSGPDCDDTDPTIFPGGVEGIGDAVDGDCDGGPDTFALEGLEARSGLLDEATWTSPAGVAIAHDDETLWITVSADRADLRAAGALQTSHHSLLAFGVPMTTGAWEIDELVYLHRLPAAVSGLALSGGHDVVMSGDSLIGALGHTRGTERSLRLAAWDVVDGRRSGAAADLDGGSSAPADFDDVQVGVDASGAAWAVGCEATDGDLQLIRATPTQLSAGVAGATALHSGRFTERCELDLRDAPTGRLYVQASGRVDQLSFTTTAGGADLGAPSAWFSRTGALDVSIAADGPDRWAAVAGADGNLWIVDESGAFTEIPEISAPETVHLQLTTDSRPSSPELIVAATTTTGGAWVAWGDPTGGFTALELDVPFAAEAAAAQIGEDDQTLIVVVIGATDVAWGVARR